MNASLTRKEAAAILNCVDRTIDNLIKAGKIQAFYIGNRVRVCPESLQAFVMQSKASAPVTRKQYSDIRAESVKNSEKYKAKK